MYKIKFIFLIIFTLPFILFAKTEEELDAYLKSAEKYLNFSGSVLIIKKSKDVLCKSYGYANYEHKVENTNDTIFCSSSLDKIICIAAILHLEEQGIIDFNKPVSFYLPSFSKRVGEKIKISNLLDHSSGIGDYTNLLNNSLKNSKDFNKKKLISEFSKKKLLFKPGQNNQYSSSNYFILKSILEEITQVNYEKYIEENFFFPLNMLSSKYDLISTCLQKKANTYGFGKNAKSLENFSDVEKKLYVSIEDILSWEKGLSNGDILSRNALKKLKDQTTNFTIDAIELSKKYKTTINTFIDKTFGYTSTYAKIPKENMSIIILSNNEESPIETIFDSILAILYKKPYSNPSKPLNINNSSCYHNYIGKYIKKNQSFLEIFSYKDHLFLIENTNKPLQLISAHENEFICDNLPNTKISFHKDSHGEVSYLIMQNKKDKTLFKKDVATFS